MTAVDPITLEVISASLSGIVREMQNSLFRTGFSTIIRESEDASCGIVDREGRLAGQHVIIPVHMGAFPACVKTLLESYPLHEIAEGDAFLTNHPYLGGSAHASDMAAITPAFVGGELVGFCCTMAHKSDIGGTVPGSGSGQAREIFHEGLHLPAVRYMSRGKVIREVETIIRANSRTPDLVMGDVRGQVGTNRLGEDRLARLLAKYGTETCLAAFEALYEKTEQRVRLELAAWPDGTYEAEGFIDNDGVDLERPVRLHVAVTKTGDRILFDFSGSDDQTKGPANIRPPLVRSACYYALVAMIDPHLPNNHGLARVVETAFRERSVLNPAFPAPVNTYAPTLVAVTEIVLRALSHMVPEKAIGATGGAGALIFGGRSTKTGRAYVQYEIVTGGFGARCDRDGYTGMGSHIADCKVTPIEIIEAEFPMRVLQFELIKDSGGAGKYRGGLGYVREYLVLDEEARYSMRCDKHVIPAPGTDGGSPGRPGACIVNPGTEREARLPARLGDYILKPGDVLRVERCAGGGFGDPRERERSRVVADVLDGYVSLEQARTVYGQDFSEADLANA